MSIIAERTWNDGAQGGASGGGISAVFDPPAYQADAGLPPSANPGGRAGRGVPDVAGDASPASGYAVRVDGRDMVIGGTSAVAPLYAGLVALLNQKLGRPVGFLNPALYGAGRAAIRDITEGDNGAYRAGLGLGCLHRPGPDRRGGPAGDPGPAGPRLDEKSATGSVLTRRPRPWV